MYFLILPANRYSLAYSIYFFLYSFEFSTFCQFFFSCVTFFLASKQLFSIHTAIQRTINDLKIIFFWRNSFLGRIYATQTNPCLAILKRVLYWFALPTHAKSSLIIYFSFHFIDYFYIEKDLLTTKLLLFNLKTVVYWSDKFNYLLFHKFGLNWSVTCSESDFIWTFDFDDFLTF